MYKFGILETKVKKNTEKATNANTRAPIPLKNVILSSSLL